MSNVVSEWICSCGDKFYNVVPPVRHKCKNKNKPNPISLPILNNDIHHSKCMHRGDFQKDVECASCGGKVIAKVYECKLHGTCTIDPVSNSGVSNNCKSCKQHHLGFHPRVEAVMDMNNLTYISTNRLIKDSISMIHRFNDAYAIVGIARSGMLPANVISTALHADLYSLDITNKTISLTGRGNRISNNMSNYNNVYIIDDSIWSGEATAKAKQIITNDVRFEGKNIITVVIYAHHKSSFLVDMYCKQLSNHFFEWNFMNSPATNALALDIDGLLCNDFTEEEDDDGEKYREAMINRKPTQFRPLSKFKPVLITARLSKYRELTEQWLDKYGIQYADLIMCDLPTIQDRNNIDLAEWKARAFNGLPGAVLYVESDDYLAQAMKHYTTKNTMCPYTERVY